MVVGADGRSNTLLEVSSFQFEENWHTAQPRWSKSGVGGSNHCASSIFFNEISIKDLLVNPVGLKD